MTSYDVITLSPEMFRSFFDYGVIGRALKNGLININVHDLRQFGIGKHRVVDDTPFGGGDGMVMMAEPIARVIETVVGDRRDDTHIILTTPQGKVFDQKTAWRLAEFDNIAIICGRYAGVDERVRDCLVDEEISIGDYVLSGGEPAAMVIIDAVSRLTPGVLGNEDSVINDSFPHLLEEAQYTRPRVWRELEVPEVLLSGDHGRIDQWRKEERLGRTRKHRPDLYRKTRRALKKIEAVDTKKKKG